MKRFLIYFFFLVFGLSFFNYSFAAVTSLTTKDASLVKINTATLNANIDSIVDTAGISYWFEYGNSSSNFSFKTAIASSSVTGAIYQNITGLSPSNTYYFRVCSKDSSLISCYGTKSFTTYKNPSVSISLASNITDVTASLSGSINDLGGNGITVSYWFEYGIGSNYSGKISTPTKTTTSIGPVTADIASLKSETTYYIRLCTNTDFTSSNICSSDSTFTTNKTVVLPSDVRAPIVKNSGYEFTSQNSAMLKGTLSNLGTFSSLNYYFDYGTNLEYGNSINESKNITTAGDFSLELKNMNYGVTYYFRACVRDTVNVNNIYCSEPSYFTVVDYKNLPIGIDVSSVSNIKDKSVRINSAMSGFGGNNEIGVFATITDSKNNNFQTPQIKIPSTLRNFSILVENLLPGNSYKYSVCYYTAAKVDCGSNSGSFSTLKNVVLGNVSSVVDGDKINMIANIVDVGTDSSNYANTNTWFTYTSDTNFKNNIVLTTKKAFSKSDILETVSGLKKDLKYFYKFCANNGLDDVCSDVYNFTISSVATNTTNTTTTTTTNNTNNTNNTSDIVNPEVIPSNLVKLSSNSVKITAKTVSLGNDISTLNYISYGENEVSLKNTNQIISGDVGGYIDFTINNLLENKKYYFKICSKNSLNTYCTSAFSFSLFKSKGSGVFLKIPKAFATSKLNVKYSETMRGKILIANQSNNDLWYINPINLRRYYLGNYVNAFNVFKFIAASVSDKDFANFKNNKANASYSGKIIFKASDPKMLYYVSPKDYRMWYFVNRDEVEFIVKQNAENISNANLLKMDYYSLKDVVYDGVDKKDTDGDTLYDDLEINVYGTNPYYLDTDGDGYPDNIEIKNGFSPIINGK